MQQYSVTLEEIIAEFGLEVIYKPSEMRLVNRPDLNRPALALAGFLGLFEPERIQLVGQSETAFLLEMDASTRAARIESFMSQRPVAVIFTCSLPVCAEFLAAAERHDVPILSSSADTSLFMAALIASLSVHLAPRITRPGVLVEVYGEGILITGDSGIGKSETALELVKRGHRLIADDAVEIKKVSAKTLVGAAPESIRHYAELRGIGIIDIRRIFGMGSVKDSEKIDLLINLEAWNPEKMYDRMGLETEYTNIMDITLPTLCIPVRPGRNLAIIVEIAAMNHRQKKMGYNSAHELNTAMLENVEKLLNG